MEEADILVTGAAGHLGCALMLSLPSLGYTPIGIDILNSATTTHVGSIADRQFVEKLFVDYPKIRHVLHTATLHKPHVESHTKSDFVNTNITGTLNLLEASTGLGPGRIESFIFLSTTSVFGQALSPKAGSPAVWIDESVTPVPKNIYGVTKAAAEDLCRLQHMQTSLPVLVLRTSRFFPEPDDDEGRRAAMGDENLKCLELAYRRTDIADVVSACVAGMQRAKEIGWGKYIISAPPPFPNNAETLRMLDSDAGKVYRECIPGIEVVFNKQDWKFLPRLDRVYDSNKALQELGWKPTFTIQYAMEKIAKGEEWRSQLTFQVGKKGYHDSSTGVYTVR